MSNFNVEWVYFQGKAKWARLINPDLKFNCWSMVLYPTPESYAQILELKETKNNVAGILNVIKKDEDGYNITLKRPVNKPMRGKVVAFSPPEVLEADGKTPLRNALIGNGSDVTCKCEYYKYNTPIGGKGTAIRLLSVRVDTLIPYEMKKDFTEDQLKAVEGLSEHPPQ